jgi:hypothetical protein
MAVGDTIGAGRAALVGMLAGPPAERWTWMFLGVNGPDPAGGQRQDICNRQV